MNGIKAKVKRTSVASGILLASIGAFGCETGEDSALLGSLVGGTVGGLVGHDLGIGSAAGAALGAGAGAMAGALVYEMTKRPATESEIQQAEQEIDRIRRSMSPEEIRRVQDENGGKFVGQLATGKFFKGDLGTNSLATDHIYEPVGKDADKLDEADEIMLDGEALPRLDAEYQGVYGWYRFEQGGLPFQAISL